MCDIYNILRSNIVWRIEWKLLRPLIMLGLIWPLWSSEMKGPGPAAALGAATHPHGCLCGRMRGALLHQWTRSCHIPEASACRAEQGASCPPMEPCRPSVVHPRWPAMDTQRCGRDGGAAPIVVKEEVNLQPACHIPIHLRLFIHVLGQRSQQPLRGGFVVAPLLPQQRHTRLRVETKWMRTPHISDRFLQLRFIYSCIYLFLYLFIHVFMYLFSYLIKYHSVCVQLYKDRYDVEASLPSIKGWQTQPPQFD